MIAERLVAPHPGALTWGEGEVLPVPGKNAKALLFEAQALILPLPEGEGWGEGKADGIRGFQQF